MKIPKDWEKMLVGLLGIFIIIIGICFYIKGQTQYENNRSYSVEDEDRLEVGEPKIVDFEEIKTENIYIEKKENYIYSQISIKNKSNDILYGISVNLKMQATQNENENIIPSYHIEVLEPGDVAILSTQHEDIKDGEEFKLDYYEYYDGKGNVYTVTESLVENQKKLGISVEKNDDIYMCKELTSEVKRIDISELKFIEKDDKKYLEMDIKNISDKKLENILFILKESYEDYTVGNNDKIYIKELSLGQEYTISTEVRKDLKLELDKYSYNIRDEESKDKTIDSYDIYIKENKYSEFSFADYEISNKRSLIINISNMVAIILACILNWISYMLKEKGVAENNDKYTKYSKYISISRISIFIVYAIILLFYLWCM